MSSVGTTAVKSFGIWSDAQRERCERVCADYRRMALDPLHCRPMIVVNVASPNLPSWEARLADPRVMLQAGIGDSE